MLRSPMVFLVYQFYGSMCAWDYRSIEIACNLHPTTFQYRAAVVDVVVWVAAPVTAKMVACQAVTVAWDTPLQRCNPDRPFRHRYCRYTKLRNILRRSLSQTGAHIHALYRKLNTLIVRTSSVSTSSRSQRTSATSCRQLALC